MNVIANESTVIKQTAEVVFAYISDLENFGEWFPGVVSIKSLNTLPVTQVGKKYQEVVKIPFAGKKTICIEVKESLMNKRLATEGDLSPLLPGMTITLTSMEEETLINWRMDSRNNHPLFRVTLLPFVRVVMSRRAKQGLDQLKDKLHKNEWTEK